MNKICNFAFIVLFSSFYSYVYYKYIYICQELIGRVQILYSVVIVLILIYQRTSLFRSRIKPVRRRIQPDRRRIKPVHLVPIFSLNWSLVFLICQFLLVFSCPKRDNSTIMISINCLFLQDRHSEIVNYPFQAPLLGFSIHIHYIYDILFFFLYC